MEPEKLVKFSEIIQDSNIDEYTKSEMCKSMIFTTGIPRIFTRPSMTSVVSESNRRCWRQSSDKGIRASSSSKIHKLPRTYSYLTKQDHLSNHKQEKMIQQITVPCPKSYYANLPIKPGFDFFDCILRAPRGSLKDLKINIPESIYYREKINFIHTLEDGSLEVRTDVYGYKFLRIIEQYRTRDENSVFNKISAILRSPAEELNDMQKYVMDWPQFNMKMSANEMIQYTLIQRFIHTPGHRPAITRLHYYSNSKKNKASYAYFINSIISQSKGSYQDLQKCVVNTKDPENIEIFKKSGASIKYYEMEAKKIVKFLSKGYNLRIEKIILDFITDTNGKIWLSGCKACEIDHTTLPNSLVPLHDWWESNSKPPHNKKDEPNHLMNFIHCKLCRLNYTNNQLSHLLPVRMLMVFKVHCLGRCCLPLDVSHLKVTSKDMLSQSVRICQYCYMLVTSEFELMSVEEELGRALNIPKKEIEYEEDPKILVQRHFLPKRLTQYRILVFVSKFYEAKFNSKLTNLHIHLKFGEILTNFRLKLKKIEENGEEVFLAELIKVHYVFAAEGKSLEKLINSEILQIRLSNSDKYGEKSLGASKSQCLNSLPHVLNVSDAYYTKKQILLFDIYDVAICNLSVFIGISCDKTEDSIMIKVPLSKVADFYIPDLHFMSVDPLPVEWLELFGKEAKIEESFTDKIGESEFYTPILSIAEMLRMEDITSPYKAIPKIYKEKIKEIPKTVPTPNLPIYTIVNNYLQSKKSNQRAKNSSSALRKSSRTSSTTRTTPIRKLKKQYPNKLIL